MPPVCSAMPGTRPRRCSGPIRRLVRHSIAGVAPRVGTPWRSSSCSMPCPRTMPAVRKSSTCCRRISMPSSSGRIRRAACGIRSWTSLVARATTSSPPAPPCLPMCCSRPITRATSALSIAMQASRPIRASSRTSSA